MHTEFGYNCKYFLPTIGKCRILIDNYMIREDLSENKWLYLQDLLVYLNISEKELIKRIVDKEIKYKMLKDPKVKFKFMFQITSAWQWDDCPLTNNGGQCIYFEEHGGKKISCLSEQRNTKNKHYNDKALTVHEIEKCEAEITNILDSSFNIG